MLVGHRYFISKNHCVLSCTVNYLTTFPNYKNQSFLISPSYSLSWSLVYSCSLSNNNFSMEDLEILNSLGENILIWFHYNVMRVMKSKYSLLSISCNQCEMCTTLYHILLKHNKQNKMHVHKLYGFQVMFGIHLILNHVPCLKN